MVIQTVKSEAEHDRELRELGYYCAREHFPFGRAPWYRSDDDPSGYYLYGGSGGYQVVDWDDLKSILNDDWRPVSADDRAWARQNGLTCG